jgi:hypothetical protein
LQRFSSDYSIPFIFVIDQITINSYFCQSSFIINELLIINYTNHNIPMKEDTTKRSLFQKFLDGVLIGLFTIGTISRIIIFFIIFIMLLPLFLYPFYMFFGKVDPICIIYNICLAPITMMTIWLIIFIISPPLILGVLSCMNIIHAKPVSTLPV